MNISLLRCSLRAAGYAPLPIQGKRPPMKDWSQLAATDADIAAWERAYPYAPSTGILTKATPALDIDITTEPAAEAVEALAVPGGICVSGRVHEDVQGKLSLAFEDTGEHRLKNIARPVRVYRIELDEAASLAAPPSNGSDDLPHSVRRPVATTTWGPSHERTGADRQRLGRQMMIAAIVALCVAAIGWRLLPTTHGRVMELAAAFSREPSTLPAAKETGNRFMSIVVLPFLNLSGDPQQDRISDGITDSLTTDLSRAIPGSFVVSRDTAFAYKGKAADLRQIGRALNVRYVVEGSVLPDGDLVRVNSQLIDADTGGHLWAERFDLKRSDVLNVQDDIVERLSRAIGLRMIESDARRSERYPRGLCPPCRPGRTTRPALRLDRHRFRELPSRPSHRICREQRDSVDGRELHAAERSAREDRRSRDAEPCRCAVALCGGLAPGRG